MKYRNIYDLRAAWHLLRLPKPSLGTGPNVVMTTHKERMLTAHQTIRCILGGVVRPKAFIVYVPSTPTDNLLRLQDVGVTIRQCEPLGVHDKWYHYCQDNPDPFVTVDDDLVYPSDFLATLCAAHAVAPWCVTGLRVRRITSMLYREWPLVESMLPSHHHFALGCGGVIYPSAMVKALKASSRDFLKLCPKHDDAWLKRIAVESGIPVRAGIPKHTFPLFVPGTPGTGLWEENKTLVDGKRTSNDVQWAAILTQRMKEAIYDEDYSPYRMPV